MNSIEAAAPVGGKRGNRPRWIRVAFFSLIGLPLLAFFLSNLALASPQGRRWIASQIESRTTLETTIRSAWWTPWSGIHLRRVVVLQPPPLRAAIPEPVVRVGGLRIKPAWRSWMRGRSEIRSIHLDSTHVVLSIELLSQLMPPPPEPEPPSIAETPPAVPAPPPSTLEVRPSPALPEPPPIEAPPATVAPSAPTVVPPVILPTAWLHLRDVSFTLVSASSTTPLIRLSGIGGSIPVAGKSARSTLRIDRVESFGAMIAAQIEAPLDWSPPLLTIPSTTTHGNGLDFEFSAQLGMLAGLPLQFDAIIPGQTLDRQPLPFEGHASAEAFSARTRLLGFLLSPASLQADLVAEASSISIDHNEQSASFDQGRFVAILRNGNISCLDARLIGDDLSILGNGTLLSDGRTAAVVRFVTAPDSALALPGRLLPDLPEQPRFTALSTPQRIALDLSLSGRLGEALHLQLGLNGPIVPLSAPP